MMGDMAIDEPAHTLAELGEFTVIDRLVARRQQPPEVALGLSLVKRIPDLIIGVPGLIAWQAIEGWHFHRSRRPTAANQNERA